MVYIPTILEEDWNDYWFIVPRSNTSGIEEEDEVEVTLFLEGPQGARSLVGGASVYGPFVVVSLLRWQDAIPTGEYRYALVADEFGEIGSGVCRVFADPAETTQYNPTHNVKEYE